MFGLRFFLQTTFLLYSIQTFVLVSAISTSTAKKDLTFSSTEQTVLEQLKARVFPLLQVDYMKTDFYLIRWIRTRNNNLQQAESALLQHLKWRQRNRIDSIREESFEDMEAEFPYQMDTTDFKGQPVGTIDVYEWDLRRTILQGRTQRLMRYLFRLMEEAIVRILEAQQNGKNITRFVVVGNADNFNIVQHACGICLPVWIEFVRTFEAQYPNFVDEIIVIEAPATVNIVLDLIRPTLSAETNKALIIFGYNREKWMNYLDERISRSQRRSHYGGTRKD